MGTVRSPAVRSAGMLNSNSHPATRKVSAIQLSHNQAQPRRMATKMKMASTDRATTPKKKAKAAHGPAALRTTLLSSKASNVGTRKSRAGSAPRRRPPAPEASRRETSSTSVNENNPTPRPIRGPRLPDQ